jgi:ubiquinone/menaquinone biosynthesis C-methylase UbiE
MTSISEVFQKSGSYPMAEISQFTQPDASPAYFVDFLDFLDKQEPIRTLRAEAAKRMQIGGGQRILDVGCGVGGATFLIGDLTEPSGLAAGVDVSSALIDVAKQRAGARPGIEFRIGDACAIPYPDRYFDGARSERVFLYVPDRVGAIQDMKRVVKSGGRVCLIDTDFDSIAIYSTNRALTRKMTSIIAESIPNPNSARELPALATHTGLKDIRVESFAIRTPHDFLERSMSDVLWRAAESGFATTREEVSEWLGEQAALHASGDFYQAWLFVMVTGTV